MADPISAGIGGVAALGGAALGGKAAKQAAKTQAQTTDKALSFSREQEAQRKQVYDQKMQQWTASRNALLQRYGIDIAPPTAAGAAPAGGPGMGAPPPGTPQGPPGAIPRQMPQPGPGMGAPAPGGLQGGNLAALIQQKQGPPDLEGWNRLNVGLPQA